MDTLPTAFNDDVDLDALMVRVREAALAGGANDGTAYPQTAGNANGANLDLARVIEAQGEWNEQTRKSLAALVECLRTLQDDWTHAHTRICQEVERLSAIVQQTHPVEQKKTRRKAARPRVAVKRRGPRKANGHRA